MGNAYDSASLLVTPNGYKASKIYSAKPTDGSGDLAFSRASTAMRRNSAGLWEEVANNVPRLQYPVGGGCPSWLFEPQATNVLQQSENFGTTWGISGVTVNPNQTQSPFVGLLADELTYSSGGDYVIQSTSLLNGVGKTITASFYIKNKDFLTNETLRIGMYDGSLSLAVVYKPFENTYVIDNSGFSNPVVTQVNEVNGWTRISITGTTTWNNGYFFTSSFGGASPRNIYLSNVDLVESSAATSPIITAGSAVTRLKDVPVATVTSSANNTVYYEGSVNALGGFLLDFQNNSLGRQFVCQLNANGSVNIDNYDNGVDRSNNTASIGTLTANTKFKLCLVSTSTTRTLFINGVKFNTITSSFSGGDRIYSQQNFGDAGSMNNQSEIIYYQAALSDSEAIELTTL
jgi:hypothetical protein